MSEIVFQPKLFTQGNQISSVYHKKPRKQYISSWLREQNNSNTRQTESIESYAHTISVRD